MINNEPIDTAENEISSPTETANCDPEFESLIYQKEQQLQLAKVKIAQLEGQLNLVYTSLSWKITAPLRRFGLRLPELYKWINRKFGTNSAGAVSVIHTVAYGQSFDAIKELESINRSIGIQLHLYYTDLIDEIASYLANVPFDFSLYVSVTDENCISEVHKKLESIESVKACYVKAVPNRGRDVAPLLSVFASDLLKHDYICHIHTKKSLYTGQQQDAWRKHFFDNLVGSSSIVRKIFGIFDANEVVGIIYPETYPTLPYWAHSWLSNKQLGHQLCTRFGVVYDHAGYIDSPMGTMFWARSRAIAPLLSSGFKIEDFPEESGQTDGTLAHALERILVPVALTQGYTFCEISTSRNKYSVSFGMRNLFQYWQKSLGELKQEILRHEIITFDIFDTLVTRPLLDPDSVFALLAIDAEKNEGVKRFREIRKRAECEIRGEKSFGGDVNIDEIYRRIRSILKLEESLATRLCEREKDIEIFLNKPRAKVVEALRFAKEHNKHVILMSDMYLDSKTIKAMLTANDITGYDELYLSSEIGVRKDNATMWMKLLEKYSRSSVLHIGDNEHSDVQIPCDMGIPLYHVMSSRNLFLNSMLGRDFTTRISSQNNADSAIAGMVISRVFNDPFRMNNSTGDFIFSDKYDFGYAVLGPVVFVYLLWLLKSVIKEKGHTILFLAREGYLLKQIFDAMIQHEEVSKQIPRELKSIYLLASRRATTVAAIENFEDAAALLKKNYTGKLHNLLTTRFGLNQDYFESKGIIDKNIDLASDISFVKSLVCEHIDAIINIARMEKKSYLKYLESFSLKVTEGGIAISDLGYSGNIQKALSRLLKTPLKGFYFATCLDAYDNDKHNNEFHGCFTENDDQIITKSAVYKYCIVLESVLTAPNGQLSHFVEDGDTVKPVFGPIPGQFGNIEKVQEGITGYVNDMLNCYGRYLMEFKPSKDASQYLFEKVITGRRFDKNIESLLKIEDKYCSDGEFYAV